MLACLRQIEPGDGACLVFGLSQLLGARQVGQLLFPKGDGRAEIAELPILLQSIADQQQSGAGEILLACRRLPACLISHRGKLAPQIHFVTEAQRGAKAVGGLATFQILVASCAYGAIYRRGEVGIGLLGAQSGAFELEGRHTHVGVGGQYRIDQFVEPGIMKFPPPGASLRSQLGAVCLLPCRGEIQLGSLIGAVLTAAAEGHAESQPGEFVHCYSLASATTGSSRAALRAGR